MAKGQKNYIKEFKLEAVQLVQSGQKSQAQITRDLGVADSTLSQWRKDMEAHGGDAFAGSDHQMPLEEENRHLKREVEILRQERDILKKLSASFRTSPRKICVHCGASERVSGDAAVQGSVPVSVSGYYASRHRPVSQHQREVALRKQGWRCGRKRVVRLMQTLGLCAKARKPCKLQTTQSDPTATFAQNLLNREFHAEQPNTKWVTDITAIPTAEAHR